MPKKTGDYEQKYIDAINAHARAILELADAIRESLPAVSAARYESVSSSARVLSEIASLGAKLSPLSHDEVLREIGKCFGMDKMPEDSTPLTHIGTGGAATIVSMLGAIEDWQPFRSRGLNLSPNDLRHIDSCGELAQVISWGLRQAAKRRG
jgi:hypothetical protein